MDNPPIARLSDEQAHSVIARAIELDTRGVTTTADDLRAIASEIGIAAEAVDAALLEHARALEPRASRQSGRVRAIAAAGFPLGLLAGSLLTDVGPHTVFGGLGFIAIGLAGSSALLLLRGKDATIRRFLSRNIVLWGGITAGYVVSSRLFGLAPVFPGIMFGWCIGWLASSIIGSAAVVAIRGTAVPGPSDGASPPTLATRSLRSRVGTILTRTAALLSHFLRRQAVGIVRISHRAAAVTRSITPARRRSA